MRPRISITGSVRPSVRRSVGWLVTLSPKTRLINIFKQIIARGGLLGSLDASLHLYKTVYPSIGLSVHWSVCHASVNVFQQVKERESQEESHVVTSSHNHFIIMRTHRWPYGPCYICVRHCYSSRRNWHKWRNMNSYRIWHGKNKAK